MNMQKVVALTAIFVLTALVTTNSWAAIVSTTGAVVETDPPESVIHQHYESDTEIRAFDEVQSFTLESDMSANITSQGTYGGTPDLSPGTIPAGTVVSSHFLHLDPRKFNPVVLPGAVTFDADIIGVIVLDDELDSSDGVLGAAGTTYPSNDYRGLELDVNRDVVIIDPDLRTLTVLFEAGENIDQIRVITSDSSGDIAISPPSGEYVTTQDFDITLIVEAPGLSVAGGSATLNGSDVTDALLQCIINGTLLSGGETFRCPGIAHGMLGQAGSHTLEIEVVLSDGSRLSETVIWQVKHNTEP
jgi:hypothetical protein